MTESPASGESMSERASPNRWKLSLLMEANRYWLAAALIAACFVGLIGLSQVTPTSLRASMSASDPIETAFQAFVTAIITGVTLVVTITQLVLSQEQGPLGDQRQRMDGAMQFREDVEGALTVPVSPPDPASFLGAILDASSEHALELRDAADQVSDTAVSDDIQEYAQGVSDDASRVNDRLEDAQFGTFDVLSAALNFNYAGKIYDAREFQANHGTSLPDDVRDAMTDLLDALQYYGPAREHIKTLYFQWELINLSRDILYASVPALVVSIGMILYADDPAVVTGALLGVDNLVWLAATAAVVALAPFLLLVAYILRIGTVAKRTLAIGPIILRSTKRSGERDQN